MYKGALRKPEVLLELYTAWRHGVSIVPLCLKNGGYDFADMATYLSNLENELASRDAGALAELKARLGKGNRSCGRAMSGRVVTLQQLQRRLAARIPNVIALPFDPAQGGFAPLPGQALRPGRPA